MKNLLFLLFLIPELLCSQSRKLCFTAVYNGQAVTADSDLSSVTKMKINVFRFYISSLELLQDNKIVFREKNSYHLIDLLDCSRNSFDIKYTGNFNEIHFCLGIDSLTNVSGALGGDLDPMHGMYWTWQSGYINFKLEGVSNESPARLNEFQLHLGGYSAPYNAMQQVVLKVKPEPILSIGFDLSTFLSQINLQTSHHIMSPSLEAVRISRAAAASFYALEK